MNNFWITVKIIVMVTTFMILIEYLEVKYKDKIRDMITGKPINQYVMASLLGAIPGCMDAFLGLPIHPRHGRFRRLDVGNAFHCR